MLLGALSVGAQEKPVTAADYKQKVLEYSRQIKQSAEERIAMQHAIKAAKTAFLPGCSISPAATSTVINKYDLDFGPGMAVEMDHNTYSFGSYRKSADLCRRTNLQQLQGRPDTGTDRFRGGRPDDG